MATSTADTIATPSAALPGGGKQGAGGALGPGGGRPAGAGQGGSDLAEPVCDPEHELGGQQPGQRADQHRHGGSGQGKQGDGQRDSLRAARPEGGDEPTGRAGQRERAGRLRDEAQAGEHRAEPAPFLQVERDQQHRGGAEGTDRDESEVNPGDATVLEQGQVEKRSPGPALPDHEPGQQQGRDRRQQHRLGGLQGVAGPGDGEHDQGDTGGHGDGAGDVQLPPAPRRGDQSLATYITQR
jgi:hypothetical protein